MEQLAPNGQGSEKKGPNSTTPTHSHSTPCVSVLESLEEEKAETYQSIVCPAASLEDGKRKQPIIQEEEGGEKKS